MRMCIERKVTAPTYCWPWRIDGAQHGMAIAVIEIAKARIALMPESDWLMPFGADEKICISMGNDEKIELAVTGLSRIEALEGLRDVQVALEDEWFHGKPPTALAVDEPPPSATRSNGHA